MLSAQVDLLSSPSVTSAERERKAHQNWVRLAKAEEKFIYPWSRVTWVKLGDCISSLFHRSMQTQRSGNQIHYLIYDQNNRLENINDIKSHCVDYYTNLLGSSSPSLSNDDIGEIHRLTSFKCDEACKGMLMALVSQAEIKKEVFDLPANKAPGPDGYTGEFYRRAWPIIGNDFTQAVQEFFSSGHILK